jgi:hypothetical protein
MSAASSHPSDPFANFTNTPADLGALPDDRDLNALERLFDRLKEESKGLRADARILGDRVERLGRTATSYR